MSATVSVPIVSRWDVNRVLFLAEINAATPAIERIKVAIEMAVKARTNLARADLAGANLADAYLARADLAGANLAGANLAGANLADAYLARANLAGATWREGVKLNCAPVKEATRSDGYRFLLLDCDLGWRVSAGCRFFSLEEAWRHWGHGGRANTPLGEESEDILVMFEHHIQRLENQA